MVRKLYIYLDLKKEKMKILQQYQEMHYSIYYVFHRTVHLLVLITFVIQFVVHGMNNMKIINTQQVIIIHHCKNTRLPEDCNFA